MNKGYVLEKMVHKLQDAEQGSHHDKLKAYYYCAELLEKSGVINKYFNRNQLDKARENRTLPSMIDVCTEMIQSALASLEAEIDLEDANKLIEFDETWRSRVHTYLSEIRRIIDQSDATELHKQKLFSILSNLERAVDKNKADIETIKDFWLSLTSAIGAGAKNLEPAVRLLERFVRGVSRLSDGTSQQRLLPKPEDAGLDPLSEENA